MLKTLVIFIDMGDTIIDESTQVYGDDPTIVLKADCVPGAKETLIRLHEEGYPIAMVADGKIRSFQNLTAQHDLDRLFTAKVISEELGEHKPARSMFQTAMERMQLTEADKSRVVMIGNNIQRDIVGANRFGIHSILLTWSPRYSYVPQTREEEPNDTISEPRELLPLIGRLNEAREKQLGAKHDRQ